MLTHKYDGVINSTLAKQLRLPQRSASGATCTGFNGSTERVHGVIRTPLHIGRCVTEPLNLLVIDAKPEHDIIIGQEALGKLDATLHAATKRMTNRDHLGRQHSIINSTPASSVKQSPRCLQITYKKAMRTHMGVTFCVL
jgi:Aspartyl protease